MQTVFITIDGAFDRESVAKLTSAGVPVVPVTAMTLDEIEPIARDLGLRHAMIIEAGGAIARWRDGDWAVEPRGPDTETRLNAIRDIEDRSGASLLVYDSPHCFGEPFVIEAGDLEAVRTAAAEIGFEVRRGRRFLHLCRASDEDDAIARVRNELTASKSRGRPRSERAECRS